jgi:hypothetical protein
MTGRRTPGVSYRVGTGDWRTGGVLCEGDLDWVGTVELGRRHMKIKRTGTLGISALYAIWWEGKSV